MSWRSVLPGLFLAATCFALPAHACVPAMLPPQRPDESQDAYKTRVDAEMRRQAEQWAIERQANAVSEADLIFVGRTTDWWPPARMPKLRPGQRVPPPVLVPLVFPAPVYFKPVAWFRGEPSTDLFALRGSTTSCGPIGFGDTGAAMKGDLYVFFARKGPLSQKTMIDAISVDAITDPALIEFVAKYRGRSPKPTSSNQ